MPPSLYAPSPNLTLIGKGAIWFDREVNGVPSGSMMALGNCDKFSIAVKPTVKKVYTSLDSTAAVYNTAVSQVDLTLTIEGFEFGDEQIALVSQAAPPTSLTQASATVTTEVLATAPTQKLGRGFRTLNREISALIVTQSTTTLVNNVDYVLKDAHSGLIYFPEGSAVVNTAAVTVAYSAAAIAASANMRQVLGASVSMIRGKLFFYADPMTGPSWDVEVPRVLLTGGTDLDYIGNDFGKWKLTGDVQSNLAFDPTIPYYRQTRRA
jgi:hypothetical protein